MGIEEVRRLGKSILSDSVAKWNKEAMPYQNLISIP